MDDLTHTLLTLCHRNRDGGHTTQGDRRRTLTLISRQLKDAGFRRMRASSLKSKHVEALLARWKGEGLAAGAIKNRMAVLRWWAEKIGRAGIIPADNDQLAIPRRALVTNESKARHLGNGRGDPDITPDELRAALDLAEYKRRELAHAKPADISEGAKLLTILPNAAELYRRQIALGLDGAHPQIMLKARLAIRELLGQIRLEPGEDGSLWAAYEVHPAVLVRDAVTGYAG